MRTIQDRGFVGIHNVLAQALPMPHDDLTRIANFDLVAVAPETFEGGVTRLRAWMRSLSIDRHAGTPGPGGHTHTHDVEVEGRRYAVDTGFIVCNPVHYPLFLRLLDELGVATQPTTMSFAVRNDASGLEYNATSIRGLFLQKRRLFSPRHWRMIGDILRFYREAPALLDEPWPGPSLGDYLEAQDYSEGFRDDHLVPMASALWSFSCLKS